MTPIELPSHNPSNPEHPDYRDYRSDQFTSQDPLARLAERQGWISADTEQSLQRSINSVVDSLGGDKLRSALHGDWLHEPLHSVITDIPIGAWTATVAFDSVAAFTGSESMNFAADATVVLGLVGAAGAAITGMNDWSGIDKPAARKIGLVHGLLNVAATGIFIGSLAARGKSSRSGGQSRSTARALAALGYLVLSVSAHLGGNLIYEHGIGVQPQPRES